MVLVKNLELYASEMKKTATNHKVLPPAYGFA
jgi:hypothetical protein